MELSRRGKQQMEPQRGRPRDLKSVRGHAGERPALKWPIACALANGKGYAAASDEKAVNRSPMTVWTAAQSMGLSGEALRTSTTVYDFGLPVTAELIRRLQQISGLLIKEFAEQVGISLAVAVGAIRPRREGQRTSPEVAMKVIQWRRETVQRLLATTPKSDYRVGRYGGPRVLKTLFPDLRGRYELLRTAILPIRAFLKQSPEVGSADAGEFICQQAMLEAASKSRKRNFTSFLPWAAQRSGTDCTFLDRHWNSFKGHGSPGATAFSVLAVELGATHAVVSGAVKLKTHGIPPNEMRHLLRAVDLQPTSVARVEEKKDRDRSRTPKNEGGRPPKKRPIFLAARRLRSDEHLAWPEIARRLDLEGYKGDPRKAGERMRLGVKYLGHTKS
jgi:hypothetical protein